MSPNTKKVTILLVIATGILMAVSIYLFAVANLFTKVSHLQEQQPAVVAKLSYKECELKANQEYTDKIKLFGTSLVVDGKRYDSLSQEQWEQLNNDRIKQIENC